MIYIIIGLILALICLILIIVRKSATIKMLTELDDINFNDKKALRHNLTQQKEEYKELLKLLDDTEVQYKKYISMLVTSNIKVYTQSNFYAAYSFFNGRFYAKINNKEKNNKAEGIPVIEVPNNKNAVINLYDLSYAIKYNPNSDIDTLIKDSTVLKEVLIEELHNKVLKTYKR